MASPSPVLRLGRVPIRTVTGAARRDPSVRATDDRPAVPADPPRSRARTVVSVEAPVPPPGPPFSSCPEAVATGRPRRADVVDTVEADAAPPRPPCRSTPVPVRRSRPTSTEPADASAPVAQPVQALASRPPSGRQAGVDLSPPPTPLQLSPPQPTTVAEPPSSPLSESEIAFWAGYAAVVPLPARPPQAPPVHPSVPESSARTQVLAAEMAPSCAATGRVEVDPDEAAAAALACEGPEEEDLGDADRLQVAHQRLDGHLATLTVVQQLAKGS